MSTSQGEHAPSKTARKGSEVKRQQELCFSTEPRKLSSPHTHSKKLHSARHSQGIASSMEPNNAGVGGIAMPPRCTPKGIQAHEHKASSEPPLTSPDSQSASSKHCPPQVVRYLPFDEHQNLAADSTKERLMQTKNRFGSEAPA